jgi:hypothetical protein
LTTTHSFISPLSLSLVNIRLHLQRPAQFNAPFVPHYLQRRTHNFLIPFHLVQHGKEEEKGRP